MGKLDGEVALVTGASRGIGRASAIALAKEGAQVWVNFVTRPEGAQQVCQQIQAFGGQATPLQFDVSDPTQVKSAFEKIQTPVSILVNNSGITRDGLLLRAKLEDWDLVMNTNLRGTFLVSQAVLKSMMKARKGSIINISSIVGIIGNAGQAAYCASKAGMIGFTKSLAKEVASRNIRVNVIAPGFIATDMTEAMSDEQKLAVNSEIPLGRQGTVEEIASSVVFLASSDASYITGQVLRVDGGMGM